MNAVVREIFIIIISLMIGASYSAIITILMKRERIVRILYSAKVHALLIILLIILLLFVLLWI